MQSSIVRHLLLGGMLLVLLLAAAPVVEPPVALAQPPAPTGASAPLAAVAASTPETLILDDFDEWTVGGGYIYWATNCHSTGPNTTADAPRTPADRTVYGIESRVFDSATRTAYSRLTQARVQEITAAAGLPPGSYVVPIVARSGRLAHTLNLVVEVVPLQNSINLPLLLRPTP